MNFTPKRRAMTSEEARRVKLAGHLAEQEFADLIGGRIYSSAKKKIVVDTRGGIHLIKSSNGEVDYFVVKESKIFRVF